MHQSSRVPSKTEKVLISELAASDWFTNAEGKLFRYLRKLNISQGTFVPCGADAEGQITKFQMTDTVSKVLEWDPPLEPIDPDAGPSHH